MVSQLLGIGGIEKVRNVEKVCALSHCRCIEKQRWLLERRAKVDSTTAISGSTASRSRTPWCSPITPSTCGDSVGGLLLLGSRSGDRTDEATVTQEQWRPRVTYASNDHESAQMATKKKVFGILLVGDGYREFVHVFFSYPAVNNGQLHYRRSANFISKAAMKSVFAVRSSSYIYHYREKNSVDDQHRQRMLS